MCYDLSAAVGGAGTLSSVAPSVEFGRGSRAPDTASPRHHLQDWPVGGGGISNLQCGGGFP